MSNEELQRLETELKEKMELWEDLEYIDAFDLEEYLEGLEKFATTLPEELILKHDVAGYCKKLREIVEKKFEEDSYTEEEIEEIRHLRLIKKQEEELYWFKLSKMHTCKGFVNVLPVDKDYEEEAIEGATKRIKSYAKTWKEAEEYYKHNDLDTMPNVNKWTAEIYEDYLQWRLEKDPTPAKKLDKNFYRAKDLDRETKRQAVAQGFKYTRKGVTLGGTFSGGGYYIKGKKNESEYHFVMKHVFKELHPKMQMEYEIDGMRADVALITGGLRLAIEIESGTNNKDQLTAKAQWVEEHFDHCVFVCSRDHIKKFKELLNKYRKITCLATKDATDKIRQLLHSYKL